MNKLEKMILENLFMYLTEAVIGIHTIDDNIKTDIKEIRIILKHRMTNDERVIIVSSFTNLLSYFAYHNLNNYVVKSIQIKRKIEND